MYTYSSVHPSWRALAFLILILYLVILAPARRVDYWIRLNTLSAALIALIAPGPQPFALHVVNLLDFIKQKLSVINCYYKNSCNLQMN